MTGIATILLAEDDKNDVLLMRRALEKAGLGHVLVHVPDGEQCIRYLRGDPPYSDRAQHPFPNLLLLDLKMPVLSGMEVLHWIHDQPRLQGLPVIVLTGSVLARDKEDAAQSGAADFHIKPVKFEDLVRIMQAIDSRWLPADANDN